MSDVAELNLDIPPPNPDEAVEQIDVVQGMWVTGRFEGHFTVPTSDDRSPPVMGNADQGHVELLRGLLTDVTRCEPPHYRAFTRDRVQTRLLKKAWLALGTAPSGRARVHEVDLRNLAFVDFSAEILNDHGPTAIGLIRGTVVAQLVSPRWPRFAWLVLVLLVAGLILSSPLWWRWAWAWLQYGAAGLFGGAA